MANLIKDVTGKLKEPCVAVLDAYFAVGSAFAIARTLLNSKVERLLHIVTRAKSNIVAREERPQAYGGRGRPRQYGKRIKLDELFTTRADAFSTITVNTYGETRRQEILCLDLVWQAIREKLRIVLIKDDTSTFILICSDLNMSLEEIVELYACRSKIEVAVKMVKHIIGGLYYHFWTTARPENVTKALTVADLEHMTDNTKRLIAGTMNAIEGFVNMALIATGLLQILALQHA